MTHPLILEGLLGCWSQERLSLPGVGLRGQHQGQGWYRGRSIEGYGYCSSCDTELAPGIATPFVVQIGNGRCRICDKAYKKRYYQHHLGVYATARANRRVRILGAAGTSDEGQRKARAEMYGGLCYLCGQPATAMDHVIPLAKGGTNWPANLRPICAHCNGVKGAKWPYDIKTHRQLYL